MHMLHRSAVCVAGTFDPDVHCATEVPVRAISFSACRTLGTMVTTALIAGFNQDHHTRGSVSYVPVPMLDLSVLGSVARG